MTDQQENLFEADKPKDQTTETQPKTPAPDQLLASIVNEQGKPKYSSVEDALKALQASQEHIKRIETENAEYRNKVTEAATIEDILKAIKPGEADGDEEKPSKPAPKNSEELDVESLVIKALEARESKKIQESNTNTVVTKLKELYGEKASETFYQKAKELGMDKKEINALAAKSPNAVFKLLGIEVKTKTPSVEGIRSEALDTSHKDRKPRSAMAYGSSADLVDAWRQTQEKVNKRLGIQKG